MTLAELVVAVLVAAGVALAIGHVTVQMTSGASRVDQRLQMQTEAAVALVRLRTELEQATGIVALTFQKVIFRHPDASGDGQPDVLSYEWSGTTGDALTRELNSGGKEPVLEQCRAFSISAVVPPIHLVAGLRYPLKLEYYQKTGSASCRLMWSATGVSKQVVPQTSLYPAFFAVTDPAPGTGTPGVGLTGQYYGNADLTSLVMTRTDATVDMNWMFGGPGGGMGSNNFSVRWTGQAKPAVTGDYTFYVNSDDGVRLWVNDCLVIDSWTDRTAAGESSVSSVGLSRMDIHVEAGPAGSSARLDGAVRLLNQPCMGS
jgi:hypothetical protein